MTMDIREQYRDKLEWLEMGIPYVDSPNGNPNPQVFTLAMPWKYVEPIIKELEELKELAK